MGGRIFNDIRCLRGGDIAGHRFCDEKPQELAQERHFAGANGMSRSSRWCWGQINRWLVLMKGNNAV